MLARISVSAKRKPAGEGELIADLVERHRVAEPLDHRLGGGDRRHIERNDQPVARIHHAISRAVSVSRCTTRLSEAGGALVLQIVHLVERLARTEHRDLLRDHQRAAAELQHLAQRHQRAQRAIGPSDAPPIANARFLNTASGGSPRSRTREIQSMVFFSSGVIEALYSGLAMNTP